jgi:hypothetical protein
MNLRRKQALGYCKSGSEVLRASPLSLFFLFSQFNFEICFFCAVRVFSEVQVFNLALSLFFLEFIVIIFGKFVGVKKKG